MNRDFQVYGIGNAIIDLQLQVSDDCFKQLQLKKGGMQLVDTDAQKRILRHLDGQEVNKVSGGSAANTIIALAELGSRTGYSCSLGSDHLGDFYQEEMKKLGIEVHAGISAAEPTGTCVILVTPDAERTMNTNLGASAAFGPDDIDEQAIANSEWLYVEGYLFSTEGGRRAVSKAVELAKSNGTKVAVTCSDGFIVNTFREDLERAIENADLVFANLDEAIALVGSGTDEDVAEKLARRCPLAVTTMSERGAIVVASGGLEKIEPFSVDAVDATGAGDMFAGAFLHGLLEGMEFKHAGKLACYLASRIVTQLGPRFKGELRSLASQVILLLVCLLGVFPILSFDGHAWAEEARESEAIDEVTLVEGILKRLRSKDRKVRLEASVALREVATKASAKTLSKELQRGNSNDMQLAIIETMGRIGTYDSREALLFEFEHGSRALRRDLLLALGNLKDNYVLPVLLNALRRGSSFELRKAAAVALGTVGTEQSEYSLRTGLSGIQGKLRKIVEHALATSKGEIDPEHIDENIPGGRKLTLHYKGTKYFLYHPVHRPKGKPKPWLLVCIHDRDLNAQPVFEICLDRGKKDQIAVLAPEFDAMNYFYFSDFNIRGQRSDKRLFEIIDFLKDKASLSTKEIFAFGIGAGGEFVQRLVLNYPERIARAAYWASKPTAIEEDVFYPEGLLPNPFAPDLKPDFYKFLKSDVAVMLASLDEPSKPDAKFASEMKYYVSQREIIARAVRLVAGSTGTRVQAFWQIADPFIFPRTLFAEN